MTSLQNPYRAPDADVALVISGADYQAQVLSASGRIGRLRYLAYGIFFSMAVATAVLLATMALAATRLINSPSDTIFKGMLLVAAMLWFAAVALLVKRRLNDINRSSWWCLLVLIPVVNLLLLLLLAAWPGDAARNAYGAAPSATPRTLWLSCLLPLLLGLTVEFFQSYDSQAPRAAPASAGVTAGRSP